MTEKAPMSEADGPGMRANRALSRRWRILSATYIVLVIAFGIGMAMAKHGPAAGFPPYPPAVGIAAAIFLPLLTIVAIWFGLRQMDEVQRRITLDSWAAGFMVIVLGLISYSLLWSGGVVPVPGGRALAGAVMIGGTAAMIVAFLWLRWRRI